MMILWCIQKGWWAYRYSWELRVYSYTFGLKKCLHSGKTQARWHTQPGTYIQYIHTLIPSFLVHFVFKTKVQESLPETSPHAVIHLNGMQAQCGDPAVTNRVEIKISQLCAWVERHPGKKAQACLAFFEKRKRQSWLGIGVNQEDRLIWEQWWVFWTATNVQELFDNNIVYCVKLSARGSLVVYDKSLVVYDK